MQNCSLTLRAPPGQWGHLLSSWSHANTWGFLERFEGCGCLQITDRGQSGASEGYAGAGASRCPCGKEGQCWGSASKPEGERTGFSRGIITDGKQSLHEVRRMRDSPNLGVSAGAPGSLSGSGKWGSETPPSARGAEPETRVLQRLCSDHLLRFALFCFT